MNYLVFVAVDKPYGSALVTLWNGDKTLFTVHTTINGLTVHFTSDENIETITCTSGDGLRTHCSMQVEGATSEWLPREYIKMIWDLSTENWTLAGDK